MSESQRYYLVDSKLETPTVMMEATTLEKILKGQGKVPKILILNLDVKAQETPKIYKVCVGTSEAELEVKTVKMIATKNIDTRNKIRVISPTIDEKKRIVITDKTKVYVIRLKKGKTLLYILYYGSLKDLYVNC